MIRIGYCKTISNLGGEDLYANHLKAAALGQSLIINHPFIDGNKRTGMLAMAALIIANNLEFVATPNEFYNFVINISTGSLSFEAIVAWLKVNTQER